MKVITSISTALLFLMVSYIGLFLFEAESHSLPTDNKVYLTLDIGDNNYQDLVAHVQQISNEHDIDVLTYMVSSQDEVLDSTIFTTSLDQEFIGVSFSTASKNAESHTISTKPDAGQRINLTTFFYGEVTIVPFEKLANYESPEVGFYVNKTSADAFRNSIEQLGYTVIDTSEDALPYGITYFYKLALFLSALTCICMIGYLVKRSKRHGILMLEGFSLLSIIQHELKSLLWYFFAAILSALIIMLVVIAFNNYYLVGSYLLYLAKYYVACCLFWVLMFIVASMVVVGRSTYDKIKGETKQSGVYILAMCFKTLLSIMLIINLATLLTSFQRMAMNQESKTKVMTTFSDYASLRCEYLPDESLVRYYSNFDTLYESLSREKQAVMISSEAVYYNSFDSEDPLNNTSSVDINATYLDVNTLFDTLDNELSSSSIDPDALTILAPETLEPLKKELLSHTTYAYDEAEVLTEDDVQIIWYKAGQSVTTFDSSVIGGNFNNESGIEFSDSDTVQDPVITIYNNHYFPEGYLANAFTADSMYIKAQSDDPYSEIQAYIESAGLESIVTSAPFVHASYDRNLVAEQSEQRTTALAIAAYLVVFIFTVLFATSQFINLAKRRIAVRYVSGYSFVDNAKVHFLVLLISVAVVYAVSVLVLSEEYVEAFIVRSFLCVSAFEIIVFLIVTKRFVTTNSVKLLKGA